MKKRLFVLVVKASFVLTVKWSLFKLDVNTQTIHLGRVQKDIINNNFFYCQIVILLELLSYLGYSNITFLYGKLIIIVYML